MTTRLRLEPLDARLAPAVAFRFDYSLDRSGFFDDPAVQAALNRAADSVSARLTDSLAAITPGGGNSWRAVVLDPTTDETVAFDNLRVNADELLVFVAAADLPGATLGATANGLALPRGSAGWVDAVTTRGQPAEPFDTGPWGGMIGFDAFARWSFDPAGPGRGRVDFESVVTHELAHLLGFGGGTPAFDRFVTADGFAGPNVVAAYGGVAPLDGDGRADHWAEGTVSGGQVAALTPAVPRGARRPLTPLDWAALADVGWQLGPVVAPAVPAGSGPARVAVGAGEGGGPVVTLLDAAGRAVNTRPAFADDFRGGVRGATADSDADGAADVVVGTGPGGTARVRVLGGADGRELFAVEPFEATFTGGVFVAAGDLDGDGAPELVVTPDSGGGPRVRVFGGDGFAPLADFFGIDDPNFRGGARAAVGDLTGDDVGDLLVAAGAGGGPRVSGWDGLSLTGGAPARAFADFFAFEPGLRDGVYLAGGDLDGDGFAELIAGAGPGGGPRVTVWAGRPLAESGTLSVRADFFAGDVLSRGGVRVAAPDLDRDGRADLVAGAGAGGGSWAAGFRGRTLVGDAPPALFEYTVFPGFGGGVFVG